MKEIIFESDKAEKELTDKKIPVGSDFMSKFIPMVLVYRVDEQGNYQNEVVVVEDEDLAKAYIEQQNDKENLRHVPVMTVQMMSRRFIVALEAIDDVYASNEQVESLVLTGVQKKVSSSELKVLLKSQNHQS